MKKMMSLALAMMMLMGILCVPAAAEDIPQPKIGTLSYLNMTEEQENLVGPNIRQLPVRLLFLDGVFEWKNGSRSGNYFPYNYHFDTLNALLMALESRGVDAIRVPYYTARYLCSTNDTMDLTIEYHPEKANEICQWALGVLSDGYSFMMKENNAALRDAFDEQITAMKEDGTLQQLIDEHIIRAAETGKTVAVEFVQFAGAPIKIAVTGSLPPMDYVAADGSFAGFNTAVLAEIGRRMNRNIQLVQVDSMGRALALAEGAVDAVFWTRSVSEDLAERRTAGESVENVIAKYQETMTDEEKAVFDSTEIPDEETISLMDHRDMPAGTIITQPFFSDFPAVVVLK